VNQAKDIILFADYRDREEDSQAPPDLEPVTPLPADMVGDEVSEYKAIRKRSRIHEPTISLRFLGIT
jgi:hypothetical protein